MGTKHVLPLQKIGEIHWADNLKKFLHKYDIIAQGISLQEETSLITFGLGGEIRLYYKHFGRTDSAEFMYYLRKPAELEWLHQSRHVAALAEQFSDDTLAGYVVISESVTGEPICLHIDTQAIYTFTKKPVGKHLLFHSFNDFLLVELIQLKKQVCGFDFESMEEEYRFVDTVVDNSDISQELRHEKLYKK